jgi:L-seryl-tRNA(Ser) seleniumtransferase
MLGQSPNVLETRAQRLRAALGCGEVEASAGFSGGGSLPEQRIESRALLLAPPKGPEAAARALRECTPAVVGRIARDRLVVDMLTVADDELDDLAAALRGVMV